MTDSVPTPQYSTVTAVIISIVLYKSTSKLYCQFHDICFGCIYGNTCLFVSSPLVFMFFLHMNTPCSFQLFRRVAAALPGMESLDDANPEGSIL